MPDTPALAALGWRPFFAEQITETERTPARVTEVHRNGAEAEGAEGALSLPPTLGATVGDWVVTGAEGAPRRLDRQSLLKRRAPGRGYEMQAIAANVDTVFAVTSCTRDFSVARLERYVALTFEAGAAAVIVLTKPDLCDDVAEFEAAARAISMDVPIITLDARTDAPRQALAPWVEPGRTIALLGSSGVGKSTLVNALSDGATVATQPARAADQRGRHTTTRRQMHRLSGGALVVDTPGMREVQLADADAGLARLFADLEARAATCRFRDCAHGEEPGCAIKAALAAGVIDHARVERWQVLKAENAFNTESLAGRRWDEKERAEGIRDRRARLGKGG
ncbi:ribosome small subunit-dependent GTPase A [Jannaschia marina]|uniref:ribosome small subunit-dependent GTPase A n=1 Tax=Jannaschia marina TaxID=2741674 RepID=UPI0015CB5EBA|nr:ribosome small subunit-dependent GTPase A [Jannaschia marina]